MTKTTRTTPPEIWTRDRRKAPDAEWQSIGPVTGSFEDACNTAAAIRLCGVDAVVLNPAEGGHFRAHLGNGWRAHAPGMGARPSLTIEGAIAELERLNSQLKFNTHLGKTSV